MTESTNQSRNWWSRYHGEFQYSYLPFAQTFLSEGTRDWQLHTFCATEPSPLRSQVARIRPTGGRTTRGADNWRYASYGKLG